MLYYGECFRRMFFCSQLKNFSGVKTVPGAGRKFFPGKAKMLRIEKK